MSEMILNTNEVFNMYMNGETSLEAIDALYESGELYIDADLFNQLLETAALDYEIQAEQDALEEGVGRNLGRMFRSSIKRYDKTNDEDAFHDRSMHANEGRFSNYMERKAFKGDESVLKALSAKNAGAEGALHRAKLHDLMSGRAQKISNWHQAKQGHHMEKAAKSSALGKFYHGLRASRHRTLGSRFEKKAQGLGHVSKLLKGATMSAGDVSDKF